MLFGSCLAVSPGCLFGGVSTVIAYKSPLTFLPLRHSFAATWIAALIYAAVGIMVGLVGRAHYSKMGFLAEGAATTMFLSFWSLILGAGIAALFFLLPSIDGTELRSILYRLIAGGVAGVLAANFTMVLASRGPMLNP